MAIKIECSNCGHQNDLGRIFCVQCGQKMDMHATSMVDLNARREFDYGALIRRSVVAVLVLLIAGVVGLAFWPMKCPPVFRDDAGAVQVPIKAKAIRSALSFNRNVNLNFSEGELNGFLADRAKSRKIELLAIDLKPGAFVLYSALYWSPLTNVAWLASIRVPVAISLQGSFQAGVLTIEQVHMGHLPLPGSVRNPVKDYFSTLFSDILSEKRITSSLKTVALEETKADLFLGP